jgi:hypothetical protein
VIAADAAGDVAVLCTGRTDLAPAEFETDLPNLPRRHCATARADHRATAPT